MSKQFYKTKLNIKSKKVLETFKQAAGSYRSFYNAGLDAQGARIMLSNGLSVDPFMNGTELLRFMKGFKKHVPYSDNIDQGIFTAAVFASSKAVLNHFRYHIPTYYSRKKTGMKFKTQSNVKIFYDYIKIPKIGKIKLFEKGYLPQGEKISNTTFTFDGKDWWLSFETTNKNTQQDTLTGEAVFIDFDREGNLSVNEEVFSNVIEKTNYLKELKKYKRLAKKYKRQSLENQVHLCSAKRVARTSRNMMKTRSALRVSSNRLQNIKKDYFKKIANEVARTKPTELHMLSNLALRRERQNGLTRHLRESSTRELLNIVRKKLENMGSRVYLYSDSQLFLSTLSSRDSQPMESNQVPQSEKHLLCEVGITSR